MLPFRGLSDTPLRLWSGDLRGTGAFAALGHQALWLAIFVLLGRALARRGLRRLVVEGG